MMSMAIISSAFAAEGEQTTHETVGAGEAHHEGAFPPFQTENFAPQIFWLVVIFGLLYVLMSRIALPRVGGIIENRGAKIASDLGAAREMQSKAQAAAAANDENLRRRREEAQAIGREAQNKIAGETAKQRTIAESQAAEKIRAADERIASAKAKALANVEQIAEEAAAAIVEKLTGAKVDKSTISENHATSSNAKETLNAF
jgi:F-type H+-transporting ATPase subunit b